MLVTFKDLQRMGVTRWKYRCAVAQGILRPAKLKVRYVYPRFWSWDAEKAFDLGAGCLKRETTGMVLMDRVMNAQPAERG